MTEPKNPNNGQDKPKPRQDDEPPCDLVVNGECVELPRPLCEDGIVVGCI